MNTKQTKITKEIKIIDPKLYYCEECNLEFSSTEYNGYKVKCPYCKSNLNREMLDSYYSAISIPTEI